MSASTAVTSTAPATACTPSGSRTGAPLSVRFAAWGSRYPNHDTGTVEEARDMLGRCGVGEETVAAFLGGNAIRHFGLG